jgi:hypothetical protein
MTEKFNPLQQYFRQPAIYLRLPSGGQYWPEGSLNMPESGELPVLPMTALDEITYRTPDALFNGQAVVTVIESCVPSIQNAWAAPNVDMNAILTAIRIASYGHDMPIETTCPSCQHTDEYELDLRTVMDQQRCPDYQNTVTHGDLVVTFQPMNYRDSNQVSSLQFEEQRVLQMIPNSDLDSDTKIQRLNEVMQKITSLTVNALKHSIAHIRTPSAQVSDPDHIEDFLKNCDRRLFNTIRDHIIELRRQTDLKPMHITCGGCEKEYDQPLTLDMTSFFGPAS